MGCRRDGAGAVGHVAVSRRALVAAPHFGNSAVSAARQPRVAADDGVEFAGWRAFHRGPGRILDRFLRPDKDAAEWAAGDAEISQVDADIVRRDGLVRVAVY